MDAIEKRAREIFAQWHADKGCGPRVVRDCRNGTIQMDALTTELLRMALTPPEGYVLVPVEPTDEEVRIANGAQQDFFDDNFQSEFFSSGHYMEESIRYALRTVRAARPEVKP